MNDLLTPTELAEKLKVTVGHINNLKYMGVFKEGVHFFRLDYGMLNASGNPKIGDPRYDYEAVKQLFKKPAVIPATEYRIADVGNMVNITREPVPVYPLQRRRAARQSNKSEQRRGA